MTREHVTRAIGRARFSVRTVQVPTVGATERAMRIGWGQPW